MLSAPIKETVWIFNPRVTRVRMKMGVTPFLAILLFVTSSTAKQGIVVSGGWGAYTSMEVFVPSTGESWVLPDLPSGREGHTMESLTVCGGAGGYGSCDTLSDNGTWDTHNLLEYYHSPNSWNSKKGLVLMGSNTSEWVTGKKKGEYAFPMKYDQT